MPTKKLFTSSGIGFIVLYKTFNMENNTTSLKNKINEGKKPIQTDSAEIVRRHLQDKNDEITEDDIRNVKIVTTDDEPVSVGAEATALLLDDESESAGDEVNNDKAETDPKDKAGTPWDVL